MASNRERHAIVFECKGGSNTNMDQERRYMELDMRTLEMWVTVKPRLDRHTVAYAVTGKGAHRISGHTALPLLVFGEEDIRIEGDLGSRYLSKSLSSPVSLKGKRVPLTHYPYGPDDSPATVASYVFQGIAHLVNENKASADIGGDDMVDRIFKVNHTHHRLLSRETAGKIKKAIKSQFLTDKKVSALLDKIRSGDGSQSTWADLLAACRKNVERESRQARL
ncbi:MAG: hypothetical protein OXU37_04850 [Thaumarchaeota archaeon]|nr:hypothetical protein [Nitrososphaerota archaeon]